MNKWDNDAKLLWIRVRLTGRAQTAFKQLSEAARETYAACTKSLREQFEQASKKELYLAKFQTRSKRAMESWAAFAEDLKTLDKLERSRHYCNKNNHIGWGIVRGIIIVTQTLLLSMQILRDSNILHTTTHLCQ